MGTPLARREPLESPEALAARASHTPRLVLAEDDVERGVGEGEVFGARVHEWEVSVLVGHQSLRVQELIARVVESGRSGAVTGQEDRPLSAAAAELEDLLALDGAEDVQLRFGDPPHAPGEVEL